MILPGSKGWVDKYFSMLKQGEVNLTLHLVKGISSRHQLHIASGKSGIIFGHANHFLFFKHKDSSKWTEEEKIKFLQFETLLFNYILINGVSETLEDDFKLSLLSFYEKKNAFSLQKVLTFWVKENAGVQIESVLAKRVDISQGIFDNRWWFKTMSNVFIYLDIILYNQFLSGNKEALTLYDEYAYNALVAILLAAQSDGSMDKKERSMFMAFLSSANLKGDVRSQAKQLLKKNVTESDFCNINFSDKLFCRFLLDLAFLTLMGNEDLQQSELDFIESFSTFLELEEEDAEESMTIVENYLLYSETALPFIASKKTYEKVYNNFTSRWTKVILRNKDKLALELSESKELVYLIKKSAVSDLSTEEKDKVKSQFLDLIKSVPALAIFMLPGGAILLPIILKLLPTLIPSAFRDNE